VLPPPPPPPIPVRHAAQIDPSSQLQPPYPATELRAQRDGRVQVRVTIAPDGRVIDVALISATSDAFWRETQQQALHHWRFRPATVDGRPVEDTRVMSLIFRIEDQG
jgi:protein TonB